MRSGFKYFLVIYLLLLGKAMLAKPVITHAALITAVVTQYSKAEWNISLNAEYSNPYQQKQVTLNLLLTSPSGKPVYLPCYYDNSDKAAPEWKARFAPQETGKYTYHFELTDRTGTTETAVQYLTVKLSDQHGFLHKNGYWTFKFDDGHLFRGLGENVGWESRSFENSKWTYDHLLPALAKSGANFFRTWMCPWNLPLEWQKVNNTRRYTSTDEYFNAGGIKRMEELLHLTDSLNLYFMLTLDMNSGNWKNNPYNELNGGPVKTWPEFFTSKAAMDKYKDKLRYVVARWGYSTHIAAWEFFNEIDNGVYTAGDSVLIPQSAVTEWHNEMARYLKDIDPYRHLVTTSISHRDIAGLNSIAYIDFNQKHIYKHTEKIPAIYPDYIQTYGKPYVVGEFGYRWEDADPSYAKEANYDFKRGLWYGLFSSTPIMPMSWWWEFFDDQHMIAYFSGVREISNRMLSAGNGSFQQVEVNAGLLHAQAVKCGSTYFIYLLNESDNRQQLPVSFKLPNTRKVQIQIYNPAGKQYTFASGYTMKDGTITLNPVNLDSKADRILIVTSYKR